MQHLLSAIRFRLVFLVCAVTLSSVAVSGVAQVIQPEIDQNAPNIPAHLLYEFKNDAGDVIAAGQFIKLDGSTVTIKFANHIIGTIRLSDLDEEGKAWVKKQVALQKKQSIKAQEARKIVLAVNKSQPRTIVKACSKLRPLGRAAAGVTDFVKAFMSTPDKKAKLASLNVYPRICALEMDSLEYLTGLMNQNRHNAFDVAMDKPERFLESVATMDYVGLLYLQHVAFKCSLKTDPDWISQLDEPIDLKLFDGTKNVLRRAAIKAIGEVKSEEAASLLVDMAPTVEAPINGRYDQKMLVALITALGKIGVSNSEVMAVIKRHEKDLPKESAKALQRLNKD